MDIEQKDSNNNTITNKDDKDDKDSRIPKRKFAIIHGYCGLEFFGNQK